MAHENRNHGQTYSAKQPLTDTETFLDRRRFLSGLALAGLTVPVFDIPARAEPATSKSDSRKQYLNVYDFGAR